MSRNGLTELGITAGSLGEFMAQVGKWILKSDWKDEVVRELLADTERLKGEQKMLRMAMICWLAVDQVETIAEMARIKIMEAGDEANN